MRNNAPYSVFNEPANARRKVILASFQIEIKSEEVQWIFEYLPEMLWPYTSQDRAQEGSAGTLQCFAIH
jgi:hypothetical protein